MERERTYIRKEKSDIIFGIRTVIEAIQANREINKILIQKGMNKDLFLLGWNSCRCLTTLDILTLG